jgi:hypothetical protein
MFAKLRDCVGVSKSFARNAGGERREIAWRGEEKGRVSGVLSSH